MIKKSTKRKNSLRRGSNENAKPNKQLVEIDGSTHFRVNS